MEDTGGGSSGLAVTHVAGRYDFSRFGRRSNKTDMRDVVRTADFKNLHRNAQTIAQVFKKKSRSTIIQHEKIVNDIVRFTSSK